jgi:hypothetical protein
MRTITCPRCKEQYEWKYKNKPSLGWVCEYCWEELNKPKPFINIRQLPLNDLEERRLDEDWDGDIENIPQMENPACECKIFSSYLPPYQEPILLSGKDNE